jgi:MFS family permease
MRNQIYSIGAILFSTAIFIVGNGLIGTLLPVRALLAGFTHLEIGLVGSAYFIGFVGGCFAGPRFVAGVGHSRTFAVGAGIAAATTLFQSMFVTFVVWALMRALFGFAAAIIYMVIESWLNERATNEYRGRIFSAYLIVNFSSLVLGQLMFATANPTSFALFNLAAMCYALCLIPVGMTRLPQPRAADVPSLRPRRLFRVSPVGVAGCIAVGLANGAVWTLAPVYAQDHGLSKGMLAVFMSAFTLGGALIQLPLGRFSDRVDRRFIIAGVSALSAGLGVALYFFGAMGRLETLALIAVFGMMALPLYGLSVAHTNDRIPRAEFVETSATLLMINSLASVFGPTLGALVTDRFGTASLFLYTAAIHTAMAVFTIVRLRMRDAPHAENREKFEPMPAQSSPAELELDPRSPESGERAAA